MTPELETAVITGVLDYDIKLGWHPAGPRHPWRLT